MHDCLLPKFREGRRILTELAVESGLIERVLCPENVIPLQAKVWKLRSKPDGPGPIPYRNQVPKL